MIEYDIHVYTESYGTLTLMRHIQSQRGYLTSTDNSST